MRVASGIKGLSIVTLGIALATPALAVPFTAGDLVVYRQGDANFPIASNPAGPVYLDEFTPGGSLVQSLPMPQQTVGNENQFTGSNNTPTGLLSLSQDGTKLVVPGYNIPFGNTSTSFGAPLVIGVVDGLGNIDTSTTSPTIGPIVGAAIQGNDIWMSFSDAGDGVYHIAQGGNTANLVVNQAEGGPKFVDAINIFGNQLYISGSTGSGSPLNGVMSVGSGTPTMDPQTATGLGFGSTVGFFLTHEPSTGPVDTSPAGLNTAYFVTPSGTIRHISKFSDIGGVWTSEGATSEASINNLAGLTGAVDANGFVDLYATTSSGLYSAIDNTGFGNSISSIQATKIFTAPTGEQFRGVAFAPSVPEPGSCMALLLGSIGVMRRRARRR